MPSGKRQLRSASSDARSSNSPLASGTYIKKESPGGLQSKSCAGFVKLLDFYDFPQMFQLLMSLLFWTTRRIKMRKGPVLLAICWSLMATLRIPKLLTFQIMDRQRYWKISQKIFHFLIEIGFYFSISRYSNMVDQEEGLKGPLLLWLQRQMANTLHFTMKFLPMAIWCVWEQWKIQETARPEKCFWHMMTRWV